MWSDPIIDVILFVVTVLIIVFFFALIPEITQIQSGEARVEGNMDDIRSYTAGAAYLRTYQNPDKVEKTSTFNHLSTYATLESTGGGIKNLNFTEQITISDR
jgi:hypothetical protein